MHTVRHQAEHVTFQPEAIHSPTYRLTNSFSTNVLRHQSLKSRNLRSELLILGCAVTDAWTNIQ